MDMMDDHHHNQHGHHHHHHHQHGNHHGHQYVHNHPSTASYYQSNADPYMTESHLPLPSPLHSSTITTSHQSAISDNNNKIQQQKQQKSLGSPLSTQPQPYSLSISMSPAISPVLHHHHNNNHLTPSPTTCASSATVNDLISSQNNNNNNNNRQQQQQPQIQFINNNNTSNTSSGNSNHHFESPPLTTTTYLPGNSLARSSSSSATDVATGSIMLNHHHQPTFINESISTSSTHISETTSDANTNYAITPPLPQQSTNLNHQHHHQPHLGHGNHHLLKNSTPHNYHGSMAGWNHHNQQQHPITPDSPLPSSNLNARPQSRIKSSSSSNQAYSSQQQHQQQLENDCYPYMELQNSDSYLTTSINPIHNNNKNDASFMVKTAIMNRKILNNSTQIHNHPEPKQQQPLNSNNNQIQRSKIVDKLANDDNVNETKNRPFERRNLIIFKIIEQLVDPLTKTVVKESVQKNEEFAIDIGLTSFDDWKSNHKNNNNNNDNLSNVNSTMLSNRSHAGSSGLLADVSCLTANTKSSCSNSLIELYGTTDSSMVNSTSSIDMIDEDMKPMVKKLDQTVKQSKDSKKSSDKINVDQLVDESKDKEAASALLSLQKTPIKTPKSSTINLHSTTKGKTVANDQSKTMETKKSNDTDNIVIERLKPGMKIMAKWKDKNFYPAETVKQNDTHRWMVRFEDNATRSLFENEIIRIEHLGEPKQELMVKISDDLCKASVVKKMVKFDNKNYRFELEHSDEDDRTKVIKQYQLKDVFLYGEQGTILLNRFSKPAMMAAVFADVDLDNIVSGKRSRSKKQEEKKKPSTDKSVPSDSSSDNMATTNQTKKRKTANNINKEDHDHQSIVTSNNSITSNRTLKNHNLTNSLKTNRLTSTVGHYHERSLSLSPPPIRSARSIELTIPKNELEKIFGPIPKLGSRLFQNLAFILTCGNNINNNINNDNNSNGMLDSNDSDSNPECSTPFDKTYLIKQIINGNGKVYESYEEMKKSSYECVCIADTYSRSIKFIQCLAGGVSIVSHQWIIECCRQNRILDRESYILPAGYSIITNALSSDKSTFKRSSVLFKGTKFYFGSETPEKLQQLWSPVLLAAQTTIVPNDPNIHKSLQRGQIEIVIGDASCPAALVSKIKQLKIPIVASEYIVQCLINGRKLPYDASPLFSYLHK
nr:dual specificity protein kinase splB-like isoform X2 [Dermatophagoides farinae]